MPVASAKRLSTGSGSGAAPDTARRTAARPGWPGGSSPRWPPSSQATYIGGAPRTTVAPCSAIARSVPPGRSAPRAASSARGDARPEPDVERVDVRQRQHEQHDVLGADLEASGQRLALVRGEVAPGEHRPLGDDRWSPRCRPGSQILRRARSRVGAPARATSCSKSSRRRRPGRRRRAGARARRARRRAAATSTARSGPTTATRGAAVGQRVAQLVGGEARQQRDDRRTRPQHGGVDLDEAGVLPRIRATRSPGPTPSSCSAAVARSTRAWSSRVGQPQLVEDQRVTVPVLGRGGPQPVGEVGDLHPVVRLLVRHAHRPSLGAPPPWARRRKSLVLTTLSRRPGPRRAQGLRGRRRYLGMRTPTEPHDRAPHPKGWSAKPRAPPPHHGAGSRAAERGTSGLRPEPR
jgi:hypothetical protein